MLDVNLVLTLLQLPNIGRRTVHAILSENQESISNLSNSLDVPDYLHSIQKKFPRIKIPTTSEVHQAITEAYKIRDRAEELGITIIGMENKMYPDRLRYISDQPVILFMQGNSALLAEKKIIAVVGTRNPSPWSMTMGQHIGEKLAQHDVCVVSGLAQGCDTAAHLGCLQHHGKTIAVLAHGHHAFYSSAGHALAEKILKQEGCIVSEYPPDIPAQKNFFIDRDRIQSGLSDAVLVIETDIKGGTMHTVKACLNQERMLACLVHPSDAQSKSHGNEMLIHQGKALPIKNLDDVSTLVDQVTAHSGQYKYSHSKDTENNQNLFGEL